jgi:hypothetical protein
MVGKHDVLPSRSGELRQRGNRVVEKPPLCEPQVLGANFRSKTLGVSGAQLAAALERAREDRVQRLPPFVGRVRRNLRRVGPMPWKARARVRPERFERDGEMREFVVQDLAQRPRPLGRPLRERAVEIPDEVAHEPLYSTLMFACFATFLPHRNLAPEQIPERFRRARDRLEARSR